MRRRCGTLRQLAMPVKCSPINRLTRFSHLLSTCAMLPRFVARTALNRYKGEPTGWGRHQTSFRGQ